MGFPPANVHWSLPQALPACGSGLHARVAALASEDSFARNRGTVVCIQPPQLRKGLPRGAQGRAVGSEFRREDFPFLPRLRELSAHVPFSCFPPGDGDEGVWKATVSWQGGFLGISAQPQPLWPLSSALAIGVTAEVSWGWPPASLGSLGHPLPVPMPSFFGEGKKDICTFSPLERNRERDTPQ